MLKQVSDLMQMVTGVVGVISTVLLILLNYRNLRTSRPSGDTVAAHTAGWRSFATTGDRKRRLVDLGWLLLLGSVLSLFATDAALVEGRNPVLDAQAVAISTAILLLIELMLVSAWFYGTEELTACLLCWLTLIMIVVSRGGPLFSAGQPLTKAGRQE